MWEGGRKRGGMELLKCMELLLLGDVVTRDAQGPELPHPKTLFVTKCLAKSGKKNWKKINDF